ncbi:hypothetical protein LTR50_003164 [Elasticomyces elasticus]|nr:hypothetical protein LTR50_003164 [Elasticomyces elasticus]
MAGGMAGMISQAVVYPIDTLKFRTQCETVKGGLHGNHLIVATARKMWIQEGIRSYYRGLTLGLAGMFPYASIDFFLFETFKRFIVTRNMRIKGVPETEAFPNGWQLAAIGGTSGAIGASLVYPANLLRTRLQTQGTVVHQRRYSGLRDVWRQTTKNEGYRGLFKGLTPNLVKVVPAVAISYVVYEKTKQAMGLK